MKDQNWETLLPQGFPDASHVWIYQSHRPFTADEAQQIKEQLHAYVNHWMSHNRPVRGWATVLFGQFILIMADDTMDRLCGSAVDDSVRFIKALEEKLGLRLLDRMQMGFVENGSVRIIPMNEVEEALAEKRINGDTLFFNNAIATKKELLNNWLIPVKKSFLWKRFAKEISYN